MRTNFKTNIGKSLKISNSDHIHFFYKLHTYTHNRRPIPVTRLDVVLEDGLDVSDRIDTESRSSSGYALSWFVLLTLLENGVDDRVAFTEKN